MSHALLFAALLAWLQTSPINLALNKPASQSTRSQWSRENDAQGAVDGIKNGSFGFHTELQQNPWWMVDLLAVSDLTEIRVFNRIDAEAARAATIQVHISLDAQKWDRVYPGGGARFLSVLSAVNAGLAAANNTAAPAAAGPPVFGGIDGKPLTVNVKGKKARYIKLQLESTQYFHLDEVEVYGTGGVPPLITSTGTATPTGTTAPPTLPAANSFAPASTPAAPPLAGFAALGFDYQLVEANGNTFIDGGERFNIRVTVRNSGSAPAGNLLVRISGDDMIVAAANPERPIGSLGPNQSQIADFSGVLPANVQPRNAQLRIALFDGATELPGAKVLGVGIVPSDVRETQTVISQVIDVDFPPAAVSIPEKASSVALVIGLGKYREATIPELQYATRDAEMMARYLENVGGISRQNMRVLLNDRATKTDLAAEIEEWLPRQVTPGSSVIIYYAGHGALDPSTGEAYLVPYEGTPDSPGTRLYSLKQLYTQLEALNAKDVTIILDSCFSGSGRSIAMRGRPIVINSTSETSPAASAKLTILAAATGNQISSDLDAMKHGLFTYYVLKGMRGDADTNRDRWVDTFELFSFVRDQVTTRARTELNRDQTPSLLGGADVEARARTMPIVRVN